MSIQNDKNFAKFRKQLESCFEDIETVPKNVVSKMADVGIRETKKNTPVGIYSNGVQGGTLKRNWKKTKVRKAGNSYLSGYTNNTEYAIYVNNGHRIVGSKGVTKDYVKGVRMLEQGINAAKRQTHTLFEQEVAKVKRKSGF